MNESVLIYDSDIDLANILQEQIKRRYTRKIYISTDKDIFSDPRTLAGFSYLFLDSRIMYDLEEAELKNLRQVCAQSTIVLLSDDCDQSLRRLQNNIGAQYILQKPIVAEELKEIFLDKLEQGFGN